MKTIRAESPLEWPEGLKRTTTTQQGSFKSSFAKAYDSVRDELRRMGVAGARISATLLLRNDGEPYAEQRTAPDSGVAVFFTRGKTEFVIAIDQYKTLAANMRAVAHVLDGYRTIERHGGRRLALRALEGFRALTPGQVLALPAAPWWRVLGFPEMPDDLAPVVNAYRELLRRGGHPDHGSPPEEFRYAAQAVAEARVHFVGKQVTRG